MLKENGDFMGSFTDCLGGVVRKGVPKAEDLMREGKERANFVASAVRESMPKAEELVKEGMARANLVASAVREAMPIAHEKVADLPREGKVKSQLLADQVGAVAVTLGLDKMDIGTVLKIAPLALALAFVVYLEPQLMIRAFLVRHIVCTRR